MSSPPPSRNTHLTPQFCLNTTALRDFLRLSRASIDDSISAHLNSLLTPGEIPFAPSSTSGISSGMSRSRGRQNIPDTACETFRRRILFPNWQSRDAIFEYCHEVAQSSDPSKISPPKPADPSNTDGIIGIALEDDRSTRKTNKNYWGKELEVNERLDPYSARDYSYTRETQSQILLHVLHNEEGVERIVRTRTWNVLAERCQGSQAGEYQTDYRPWKEDALRDVDA